MGLWTKFPEIERFSLCP